MSAGAVMAGKKALRASLKKTLGSLTPSEIEFQSGLVFSHVTSHPAFKNAQAVSCYLSMPSGELDTSRLVQSILETGKVLFVPRIDHDRGEIDMLRIYDEEDLKSLSRGAWGIPEPGLDRSDGQRRANVTDLESPTLDLVLLPGLAFDCTLSRLGHGKGHYDRFLTSYQCRIAQRLLIDIHSVEMPLLLGLSLSQQLLDHSHASIPITDQDWRVNGVFHPRGLITIPAVPSTNLTE